MDNNNYFINFAKVILIFSYPKLRLGDSLEIMFWHSFGCEKLIQNTKKQMEYNTLRDLFESSTSKYKDNTAFTFIEGEGYSYAQLGDKTREVAALLAEYGIKKEDKVGILSHNMPNWSVTFFSIVSFGRIAVPMLPDFSINDIRHILKHSDSKALFVSSKLLSKVDDVALERLSLVINIDTFEVIKGEKVVETEIEPLVEAKEIKAEDLAIIIYTSGTTGGSKGVMLTHLNLLTNLAACQELRPCYEYDTWLSLLPLSHTFELCLVLILPLSAGGSVFYLQKAPTPSILLSAFNKVRPTTILSVPLIIEKIYKSAIQPQLTKSAVIRMMMKFPPTRKMLHRIASKKLYEKLGGNLTFFGIGGAKLDANVERFLLEGKFPYAIGYGLTETSPMLAGAATKMVKFRSTGPQVKGVTLKLIDQDPQTGIGEIVAKGNNIMIGYYKNPEATAAAFTEDGWFRTKDLGYFDKKGWLYIKGRVSNTIIGPSGENIYPEDIESVINSHELVLESLVTENKKGKLTAFVRFNQEKLDAFLNTTKFENLKKEILDYVNEKVNKFSRISDVEKQDGEFEKTATMKIKRYLYNLKNPNKK